MPVVVSNASRPFPIRRISACAINASAVLPPAMISDGSTAPVVVRLTRKAPARTPGQSQGPASQHAAIARPDGGQIADALVWTKARDRPRRPAAK